MVAFPKDTQIRYLGLAEALSPEHRDVHLVRA